MCRIKIKARGSCQIPSCLYKGLKKWYFLLFIISSNVSAQFNFESHFNNISTDNNQSINCSYSKNKFSYSIGLKYHFNKTDNFPISVFYFKTAWATSFGERLGLNWGISRVIYDGNRYDFSAYYSGFFTKSKLRHKMYYYYDTLTSNPGSESDIIYILKDDLIGPFIGLENNIGIEFNFKLFDNLTYVQRLGGGIYYPINLSNNVIIISSQKWSLSRQFSFGLKYTIKSAHNNK